MTRSLKRISYLRRTQRTGTRASKCSQTKLRYSPSSKHSSTLSQVLLLIAVAQVLTNVLILVVLTGNAANQTYFRDVIQFQTLGAALHSCSFIDGAALVELCDSLLSVAVRITPPVNHR